MQAYGDKTFLFYNSELKINVLVPDLTIFQADLMKEMCYKTKFDFMRKGMLFYINDQCSYRMQMNNEIKF